MGDLAVGGAGIVPPGLRACPPSFPLPPPFGVGTALGVTMGFASGEPLWKIGGEPSGQCRTSLATGCPLQVWYPAAAGVAASPTKTAVRSNAVGTAGQSKRMRTVFTSQL